MAIEVDLHVHTKYSFDSLLEPKTAIKVAFKRGLSAVAVTDHNTIKGGRVAASKAQSIKDLMVIPGIEVKTDLGDVIGLYVDEEIKARSFYNVLEEIKCLEGLVILPHPYSGHKGIVEEIAKHVDVIETLNGRSSHSKNLMAAKLANDLNKPTIACSDAHFSFEIGGVRTKLNLNPSSVEELRDAIFNSKREFIGRESPFIPHIFSFTAGTVKRLIGHVKSYSY